MRVCLVGGIYDFPVEYRSKHELTPETILADGLRRLGIAVTEVGHRAFVPSGHFDIAHVHHLGRGAVLAAGDASSRLVFTGHDGPMMAGQRSAMRARAFRYVARRADCLVALSETECAFLQGLGSAITYTIPNGIPSSRFPLGKGPLQGEHHILFVGQLCFAKGVEPLFRAVARLRATVPVKLLLAFQTAPHERELRALAEALAITDAVCFLGPQTPDQLARLYGSAGCVVLPSYAESLPSVLIEALYCGASIVATAVGGVAELVGPFGRLVNPGDESALTNAISVALQERGGEPELRSQRRTYALQRFDEARMASDHLALYEELLRAPSKRLRGAGSRIVARAAQFVWSARELGSA